MKIHLGAYYPVKSLIHDLDPRLKLVLSFVVMLSIFFLDKASSMILFSIGVLLLMKLSNIPFRQLLKSLKPVLFIALFAFVINLFTGQKGQILFSFYFLTIKTSGVQNALLMFVRLFSLVIASALLLTQTTSVFIVSTALEDLLSPLKKIGFPVHELAMMMQITLRYIPTIAIEAEKIMRAQKARGANYETGSLFKRAKGYVSLLLPLFISQIKRAGELAQAMQARCYRGDVGRSRFKTLVFTKKDLYFAIASTVFMLLVFILQYVSFASLGFLDFRLFY